MGGFRPPRMGMALHPVGERGAVLVEAAIVVPLLVFLLFGIWTTARAWNVHNTLDHAAREAARYGATDPTHSEIREVAQGEVVAAAIPWDAITICTAIIEDGTADGELVVGGGSPTTQGACMASGSGPGQDPTSDDRIQVEMEYPDYPLNFIAFNLDVDLQVRAVSRSEP